MYAGKVSNDILMKYPPTVVWTSEFDIFRKDNEKFAARLKSVGKLAETGNMPGVTHAYMLSNFDKPETKQFLEEEKLAFNYLVVDN